ncbi:hypothetical protein [uncultured Psychrobacter sp.]|uniref:hypothetical protein n=1 Tax=uncultured Psychrobacter sp. TaxID=259303 RepID=UPI0034576396
MKRLKSTLSPLFAIMALSLLASGCASSDKPLESASSNTVIQSTLPITHFPTVVPKDCGDGQAKLYDECANQVDILKSAIVTAKAENKNVLIVYGGEWCIWCHVLDNYFKGKFRAFDYRWRDNYSDVQTWSMREKVSQNEIKDAKQLNTYVANNFVVAHIDNSYANGNEAIAITGLDPAEVYFYPFIVVLDSSGKYVDYMVPTDAIKGFEIRESGGEEFRGYNRSILIEQLQLLKSKAS